MASGKVVYVLCGACATNRVWWAGCGEASGRGERVWWAGTTSGVRRACLSGRFAVGAVR